MHYTFEHQQEDPFYFDREGLEQIASIETVNDGLRFFKEKRVLDVDQSQTRLWAQVEDSALQYPCAVEICAAEDELVLECSCQDGSGICCHMVAALYAYAEQKDAVGQLFSAVDSAIRDRVQRGRTEVKVEHLGGEPWFGVWQAETVASATHFPRRYQVVIRSLKKRANLSLVRNKQNLFDNVINEDATEDVVGVSKKLLDTLIEDLSGSRQATDEAAQTTAENVEHATANVASIEPNPSRYTDQEQEAAISHCIEALQQAFGLRIEQIFGSGGGLVVVLDQVDSDDDLRAEGLSKHVPVALIDRLALKGLQRLGGATPLAGMHNYYDVATSQALKSESRLQRQAGEKIDAARLLLDQQMPDSAVDLALTALLCAVADRAGRETPLGRTEAGVWAYAEALPGGILDYDQIGLLLRALSFAQGGDIPAELATVLVDDVTCFCDSVRSRSAGHSIE
ncbi:MAG: hypothetical protein K0A94_06945 [Desulfuromonadales bacterium]|nr:hypothetical protein [Desulfuromonadales bacterium]